MAGGVPEVCCVYVVRILAILSRTSFLPPRGPVNRTPVVVCVLLLLSAATVRAQQPTMNEPHYSALTSLMGNIGLYQDDQTQSWKVADGYADIEGAKCMKTLDELATAGVPASRTLQVRYDTPDFKRGVRSLAEIRKACEHAERLGKMRGFERWAQQAKADAPRREAGRPEITYYTRCLDAYGEMIKAGIAPTERVPEQRLASGVWSGTVEEIRRQWCDAGMKKR